MLATPEQLIETFGLEQVPGYKISYNIAPGQKILGIVQPDRNGLSAVSLDWGLVPSWAKDSKIGHSLINARAETLGDKPSFKAAYHKRRCLIPATGFYEWQKTENGKQAYHICREDSQLFAFAGLWEHWEHGANTLYSCTIITAAANGLMQPIHERMPVIIGAEQYRFWLDPRQSRQSLDQLLANPDYGGMRLYPVSDRVNNPRHDDRHCLE
ncbi:SOS response-associated peptidase [Methylomicrobium lacus]|uniref:SOS response-associated peptidase n=1 Tax=Methylomicrobium lacus TaxID=136992 RepID=UPI0035A85991